MSCWVILRVDMSALVGQRVPHVYSAWSAERFETRMLNPLHYCLATEIISVVNTRKRFWFVCDPRMVIGLDGTQSWRQRVRTRRAIRELFVPRDVRHRVPAVQCVHLAHANWFDNWH